MIVIKDGTGNIIGSTLSADVFSRSAPFPPTAWFVLTVDTGIAVSSSGDRGAG